MNDEVIEILRVGPESYETPAGPSLVDVLDRLLDRGVVLRAELWLTVADIDLVFVGADLFLSSPENMRPAPAEAPT